MHTDGKRNFTFPREKKNMIKFNTIIKCKCKFKELNFTEFEKCPYEI